MTCNLLGFLKQTFKTVFTATAPVTGGSGQEIYYTDVVGTIDIPSYITNLAPLINATQATADITVYLALENASPANLLVYKQTINNITFASNGGDAMIRIPPGNGTLPPLGPVTLGVADQAHRIHLGEVEVSITLLNSAGTGAFGPIPVDCPIQNINYILGSVNVDNSQGPPFAPANGFVPQFPPTANLQESGAFRFPYECDFGSLGTYPLDLEIAGTIPAYFAPNSQFSLTNAQSFLRVPTNLTTLAKNAFPQATTFHTTISSFDLLFSNASPASYNVASTAIVSDATIPSDGSQLIIAIPETGSLTVGPITTGADGTVVGVAVGDAVASVAVQDASGNTLLTLDATCKTPAPLELIGYVILSPPLLLPFTVTKSKINK